MPDIPDVPDVPDVPDIPDVLDVPDVPVCPGETCDADPGGCCAESEQCLAFGCAPVLGGCGDDDDCSDDSYCYVAAPDQQGLCVPWGQGPGGVSNPWCFKSPPAGVFFPSLQCEWSGPAADDPYPHHYNVLGSPMVAKFPFAPTLVEGGSPGANGQIVFVSYSGQDGGFPSASCCGVIRILDGETCQEIYTLDQHLVVGGSNVAIGDLDLEPDGAPEIVALAEGGGLVAFRFDAVLQDFTLMWHSTEPDGTTPDTFASTVYRWAGPSLADLTGDGRPEILFEGNVYGWDGVKLGPGPGWIGYQQGVFPVVADVDVDGEPEVMLGATPYRFDEATGGLVLESYAGTVPAGGHIALADFGPYGVGMLEQAAEVVQVHVGYVSIRALTGELLFGPYPLPGGGTGGPPTIADFDGDGAPELAAAGAAAYTVFDPDCVATPLPAQCASEGVLWSMASQDQSSNKTGSSVFDFEGDGAAEAVYGDECFVRVYDGATGEVHYSGPRSSCTWHEVPVIADVDGDFRTEIVVGSNDNCAVSCPAIDPIHPGLRCDDDSECVSGNCLANLCRCASNDGCLDGYACTAMLVDDGLGQVCRASHSGKLTGIRVYNDVRDKWVSSRPVWNQHAYSVTNVTDQGSIPPRWDALANWLVDGLNDFRRNTQGHVAPQAAPDLTIAPAEAPFECLADGSITLRARVCNRGAITAASGVSVGFYAGAPADGGAPICTAALAQTVPGAQCAEIACNVPAGAVGGTFWAAVDDEGEATGAFLECHEGNNLTSATDVLCPP